MQSHQNEDDLLRQAFKQWPVPSPRADWIKETQALATPSVGWRGVVAATLLPMTLSQAAVGCCLLLLLGFSMGWQTSPHEQLSQLMLFNSYFNPWSI